MNCKPGDLAVIVRSAAGNEGTIVRCLELFPVMRHLAFSESGPAWRVDKELKTAIAVNADVVMDSCLRPIRDPGDDAQDETLQWLPVPSVQKEAA